MKWIIISNITGILMAISTYYVFVKQSIRFKRDWKKTFNEEHPRIKNPYTQLHCVFFPIVILLIFFGIGLLNNATSTLQDQKDICIDSILEWSEASGLILHKAYINNEYELGLHRPNQYKKGDCFTIYKYAISGWTINKVK